MDNISLNESLRNFDKKYEPLGRLIIFREPISKLLAFFVRNFIFHASKPF